MLVCAGPRSPRRDSGTVRTVGRTVVTYRTAREGGNPLMFSTNNTVLGCTFCLGQTLPSLGLAQSHFLRQHPPTVVFHCVIWEIKINQHYSIKATNKQR